MKWSTKVSVKESSFKIEPNSKVLSLGSCFADEIGKKMKSSTFDIEVNPFGVIFNPFSILNALIGATNSAIDPEMFIQRSNRVYHYNYHSELNGGDINELASQITSVNNVVNTYLNEGDILQITFGTAWVYKLKKDDKIVANCHKIPQSEFQKVLLNPDILKTLYTTFFSEIIRANPKLRVILSVSPVRHVKDGIRENTVSKSILHLLCDEMEHKFEQISYFPAFEILMDELRDYRFYKDDLVHPTELAVDYVYSAYKGSYFDDSAMKMAELGEKLQKAESHRFMNASKEEMAMHAEYIDQLKNELALIRSS